MAKFKRLSIILLSALLGLKTVISQGQPAYDRQIIAGWFLGLNPEKVVYAINCGSNEDYTDMLGVTYRAVSIPLLLHSYLHD